MILRVNKGNFTEHDYSEIRASMSHFGTEKQECLEGLSCAGTHIYIRYVYLAGNDVGHRLKTTSSSIAIS